MRRLLATLAAVAVGLVTLLAAAPAASAGESISSGTWSGSKLDPQPGPSTTGQVSVTGEFRRFLGNISLQYTFAASDGGCGAPDPFGQPAAASPRAVSVTFAVPCNGLYYVRVDARSQYGETAFLDQTIVVEMPAPTVTGVTATAASDGRSIEVAWDDMRPAAPDLAGYVVERRLGDGEFEALGDPRTADDLTVTDEALPTAAGDATYRVMAIRPVPGGATVTSPSSEEAAAHFTAAPTSTTGTKGSGSGSDAGTGTGTGSGDAGTGGSTSPGDTSSPTASGGRGSAPRPVFSGTFLPPLLRPAQLRATPPTTSTTLDTGYDESLPYDLQRGDGAALEDDELASILTEGERGRGMAIPVATALVLAVWAVHLRLLARAPRPLD